MKTRKIMYSSGMTQDMYMDAFVATQPSVLLAIAALADHFSEPSVLLAWKECGTPQGPLQGSRCVHTAEFINGSARHSPAPNILITS
jgi:hypothetical protein